jgi:hypothetical protein
MPADEPLEKLNDYLTRIEATEILRQRSVALLALYQAFPGGHPSDFFVSEYRLDDGALVYESLSLFTNDVVMEAKIPDPGDEQFDFAPIGHGIRHIVVQTKAYDLTRASASSRMQVQFWLDGQRVGELRASGVNCDELKKIVTTYLIPNVTAP